jgi:nicotinamide-nucleotide amidase
VTESAAAAEIVHVLTARRETLAVAESFTGGALMSAVVDVPGASAVLRGGVVAYATDLKHALLGVDQALLAQEGAVHPTVATQMAEGVRRRLDATWGLATTGVAGPDPQDGKPPGTVHVALAGPSGATARSLQLGGDRARVRSLAVAVALDLLGRSLGPVVQPTA